MSKKGFTSIIAIIIGAFVIGVAVYFGVRQYQSQKVEKEKLAQEIIKLQAEKDQQTTEEQNRQSAEIKGLKKDIQTLKSSNTGVVSKESSNSSNEITPEELKPYLNAIVRIECLNTSGSGSLWNFSGQYVVLTNYHVVEHPAPDGHCNVYSSENGSGTPGGWYDIYPSTSKRWSTYTDVATIDLIKYDTCDENGLNCTNSAPVENLNYRVSFLTKCSSKVPINAPVVILGYPAFGLTSVLVKGVNYTHFNFIVSNGIVSGYDDRLTQPLGNLPYSNYFVSNKIDSGNSGGIALSKDKSGLCVLGIPTWLSVGNYETQGIVQNIHNVMYVSP